MPPRISRKVAAAVHGEHLSPSGLPHLHSSLDGREEAGAQPPCDLEANREVAGGLRKVFAGDRDISEELAALLIE